MPDTDRKYTEEEFALILRRAARIQDGQDDVDAGAGMTLDDIRSIAREVGIDPTAVDRAAALMPRATPAGTLARLAGGPVTFRLEGTAPGTPSETDLARLLDAVRGAADHHGKVVHGPRGFEWSTVGEVSQIHVTAVPLEEGLQIRVTADRGGAAVLVFFFNLLGWLVAAGIAGAVVDPESVAASAAILCGGALGGLIQGRIVWARTTRTIRAKLRRVMMALTGAAEAMEAEPATPMGPPPDTGARLGQPHSGAGEARRS